MISNNQINFPFEGESQINLYKKKGVRKIFHKKEWCFSVGDVIEALLDVADGNDYLKKLRQRDEGLKEGWGQIVTPLPFDTKGGIQDINFITIEGIFRLMQSVPSKNAEPFKKWLAKVGFERVQEMGNPELAVKRAITLYRVQGYDDQWIEARIRNKTSRELLAGEWDKRGMATYIGLLTDAISVGTFGVKTVEHKNIKGLKSQSLRDNMTPIELTLTTLGEQATHEIIKATNPTNLRAHIGVAEQGGRIAGTARVNIERATGNKVISSANYLTAKQREMNAEKNKGIDEIMKRLLNGGKKDK